MQLNSTGSLPVAYPKPRTYQPFTPKPPAVQFGFTPFLTGWFMSGVGEVVMSRVMHTLLNNLTESALPLLAHSPKFEQGKGRLYIAEQLAKETEAGIANHEATITEYLRVAESRFIDAASEVELSSLKAECFQAAAYCAQLSTRPQGVIKDHAQKALFHHQKGTRELRRLLKPESPALNLLKVASWPVSYLLIVGSVIIQNRPVTDLPLFTQRLLFPHQPEQSAIIEQLKKHETSTLPKQCTALRDGKTVIIPYSPPD